MRKRKIRYDRVCILILIATLLIAGIYKTADFVIDRIVYSNNQQAKTELEPAVQTPPKEPEKPVNINYSNANLYSPYAILVRLEDKKVAFEKRSEDKIYPASLTKIMTAVVAIEHIYDFKEKFVLPDEIFPALYDANASMAGFFSGEKVPLKDLLYGCLLPSGADASIALAYKVAGSEDEFVRMMNNKAQQLGMDKTNFTNVCGLHDENHYSTVKDIAVLLEYALKNDTFRKVFCTAKYVVQPTNMHPDGITLYSTMFEKMKVSEFDDGKILGGKTGYTESSGLCLASLANKNDVEYILVTAGAEGNHRTEQFNITDAFTVYEKVLQ